MADLYRFYDSADRLLYVGISLHAAQRASQHRRDKAWWPDVARMEVEHREVTEAELRRLEAEAIYVEGPRHNGRRGRPAEGERIDVRLPSDVVADLDYIAEQSGSTRARVVRRILADAVALPLTGV